MATETKEKGPPQIINPLAKPDPRRNSIVDVAKAIKIANKPAARFSLRRDSIGKKKPEDKGELEKVKMGKF